MADFDPQRAKTPEVILTKLGMVDYDQDPTQHDNFGGGSATGLIPRTLRPNFILLNGWICLHGVLD